MVETPAIAVASRLARPDGNTIAYHAMPGCSPGVLFLGGFKSDMSGAKAIALEAACHAEKRAFIRFDYFGHGESSGQFVDGTIGRWRDDAIAVLDALTDGPQVVVGSSMGGWIMLLLAQARPDRVHGLVGVASAPDFTEDLLWHAFDAETRSALARDGIVSVPSDYEDDPYPISQTLIEEGRVHLVLRSPIELRCPVRLIHGMADTAVPWDTSRKLAETLSGDDIELTLVKNGGHRLSEPADLERLCREVANLCDSVA